MKKTKRLSRHLSSSLLLGLPLLACAAPAISQVVPGAGGPQVGDSNGVPLVDINAPNAKGISHNRYDQFNVGKEGLIFNNLQSGAARSQLSGEYIRANPNGSARLIINEVTGTSPSQLLGKMEVVGNSAGLVVANPNGITCNGCGFINTPQATLTTGLPQFNGEGGLQGYAVTRGDINVTGQGLDAGSSARLTLIARALKINAGVRASAIDASSGAGVFNADGTLQQALAGEGERPEVGIDVSALGGMYAGSIRLRGSEKGVGVANAGEIIAGMGQLAIDSAGNLRLNGTTKAEQGALAVSAAGDLHADGTQHGSAGVTATAGGSATWAGTTTSGADLVVRAQQIDLQGTSRTQGATVLQARHGLKAGGTHGAVQGFTAAAGKDMQINGELSAVGGQMKLSAGEGLTVTGRGKLHAQGSMDVQAATAHLAGELSAGSLEMVVRKGLHNEGSMRTALGMNVTAQSMRNSGELASESASVAVKTRYTLDNQGGSITAAEDVRLDVAALDNGEGGALRSKNLTINASGTVDNAGGSIHADRSANLDIAALDNGEGGALSGGTLSINASGAVRNMGGRIRAHTADIRTWLLDNTGGSIEAGEHLAVDATRALRNRDGAIDAGTITLRSGGMLDNRNGTVTSPGQVSIDTAGIDNRDGRIAAANIAIQGNGNLFNQRGQISAEGMTRILLQDANTVDNRGGRITGSNVELVAGTLNNQQGSGNEENGVFAEKGVTLGLAQLQGDGRIYGKELLKLNMRGDYRHDIARLQTDGWLSLNVAGTFTNAARLSAGRIDVFADQMVNLGELNAGGQIGMDLKRRLDNRGVLAAGTSLSIKAAEQIDNTGLITGDRVSLAADRINNGGDGTSPDNEGTIAATTSLGIKTHYLRNRNAVLSSGGDLVISATLGNARRVENLGGEITAGGELKIRADEFIDQPRTPKLQAAALLAQPVAALSPACDADQAGAAGASARCVASLQ